MRFILGILLLFVIISSACSDSFIIPYDCYPKKVKERFAQEGLKLDLNGNDRTKDSWGFLINEGSQFTIYTYHSATKREMALLINLTRTGE